MQQESVGHGRDHGTLGFPASPATCGIVSAMMDRRPPNHIRLCAETKDQVAHRLSPFLTRFLAPEVADKLYRQL
jgi:hypothetical protein